MPQQPFAGDKKAPMKSPLAAVEKRFIEANVDKFPPWIETHHLTLLTLPWSAGMVLFGYLARYSPHWLWLSSLMLFLQWFTDSFDGALGRRRETGLVKWGFYMDHFLDFVFMSAVFVGYALFLDGPSRWLVLVLGFIYQLFMVSSFLSFAATNEFKITYLGVGPTEIRLAFILLNTAFIFFGVRGFETLTPWFICLFVIALCVVVFRAHKTIWAIDMAEKPRARSSR